MRCCIYLKRFFLERILYGTFFLLESIRWKVGKYIILKRHRHLCSLTMATQNVFVLAGNSNQSALYIHSTIQQTATTIHITRTLKRNKSKSHDISDQRRSVKYTCTVQKSYGLSHCTRVENRNIHINTCPIHMHVATQVREHNIDRIMCSINRCQESPIMSIA